MRPLQDKRVWSSCGSQKQACARFYGLTGMGCTEAPLQPERLCTLWRRRNCQSMCNILPIPEEKKEHIRLGHVVMVNPHPTLNFWTIIILIKQLNKKAISKIQYLLKNVLNSYFNNCLQEIGLQYFSVYYLWGLFLPLQSPDGGRIQSGQYCQVGVKIIQFP